MAIYDYECKACDKIYEIEHSVHQDPVTTCELCGTSGQMTRLISYAAPGRVELTGHDLKQQIDQDAKTIMKNAIKDERILANLVGEDKYNQKESAFQKQFKERRYLENSAKPLFSRK